MKTSGHYVPLAAYAIAATLLTGCCTVSLPAAKSYSVRYGDTTIAAKSVKIHGSWAELQTDSGPVWVSGAVITPKN